MRLATWDLPEPQGPMQPDFPCGDALTRTPDAIRIYLPPHYPLIGDDDIQRQISDWQRQKLKDRGISPSLAGLPHHDSYGQLFRVIHVERTIRSRFGIKPPHGLAEHIIHAAAMFLKISPDRVRTIRNTINRCRRGERDGIRALQIKN